MSTQANKLATIYLFGSIFEHIYGLFVSSVQFWISRKLVVTVDYTKCS